MTGCKSKRMKEHGGPQSCSICSLLPKGLASPNSNPGWLSFAFWLDPVLVPWPEMSRCFLAESRESFPSSICEASVSLICLQLWPCASTLLQLMEAVPPCWALIVSFLKCGSEVS